MNSDALEVALEPFKVAALTVVETTELVAGRSSGGSRASRHVRARGRAG